MAIGQNTANRLGSVKPRSVTADCHAFGAA